MKLAGASRDLPVRGLEPSFVRCNGVPHNFRKLHIVQWETRERVMVTCLAGHYRAMLLGWRR
jgi:hypothetical protein